MNLLDDEFLKNLNRDVEQSKADDHVVNSFRIYEAARAFHAIAPDLKEIRKNSSRYLSGDFDSEQYSKNMHSITQKIAQKLEGME